MPDPLRTDTLHRYEWDVDCALMQFRRAAEQATTSDELFALAKRVQALERAAQGTLDYIRTRTDRQHYFANIFSPADHV